MAGQQLTDKYRADPRYAYVDTEDLVNSFGYRLLEQRRFEAAIAMFELNAAEYPRSANTYDSLGEAYLLAGRKDEARRSYCRVLELDPSHANAIGMLQQLRK